MRFVKMLFVVALLVPASAAADEIKFFLTNTGTDTDARARARFDAKDDQRQRFEVKVEALTPGDYAVLVAGQSVGTFEVAADGEGRLRLEGEPLGFDPRGQMIDVKSDPGEVFFTGTLPASRDAARTRIKVRDKFENTGAEPDARAEARLRSRQGTARFEVRVKDLPAGTYDLRVGGVDVADIAVGASGRAKAKFDSRFARGNKRLLTFDPLCQPLAISETVDAVTTTLLTVDEFGSSLCGTP